MGIRQGDLRFGCDSAFLKVLLAMACAPAVASPQLSSGSLFKAHSALEGPTQCDRCHVGDRREREFRCLPCHSEIRSRLAANRGFHPSLMHEGPPDVQCVKCHSDHNGENFVPIHWDVPLDEFDHRKTGYPLDGGHAHLKCSQCHNPDHIAPAARADILVKDLKRTYLGLSRDCASCHQDVHQGQLGSACERCHITANWKDVTRFDHAASRFPLTGAHARTPCRKCHLEAPPRDGGKPYVRYVGVAFAQCASCHRDPHHGAFAESCNACHNDVAWKPARGASGQASGIAGAGMLLLVYLYPLRRKWSWLSQRTKPRHWLDYHNLMGLAAAIVIAFHAAFKLRGVAGLAWWSMIALVVSGVVGRYLFAKLPSRSGEVEASLNEMERVREGLMAQVTSLNAVTRKELKRLLVLPSADEVQRLTLPQALWLVMALDVRQWTAIWRLRRSAAAQLNHRWDLRAILPVVRRQTALSKEMLFLAKSRQLFRLWHMVHRPFAYALAILTVWHVFVVTFPGF